MIEIKNIADYPMTMKTHVGRGARVEGPVEDQHIEPGQTIVLLPAPGTRRFEDGVAFTFQPKGSD